MRYFIVVFAVLIGCSFCSCKKENHPTPSSSLTGTWRWVRSVGGIGGVTLTPASEGFSQTQVFGTDSTYRFYRNDSLQLQGTFSVVKNYKMGAETVDVLQVNVNGWNKSAFTVRNDTLYTSDFLFVSDGFSTVYVREK